LSRWINIGLAILGILTVAFIGLLYWLPDFRTATRDVAVIILALFSMIGTILSIALLLSLVYTVQAINRTAQNSLIPRIDQLASKLDQVMDSGRQIAGNVQDTTSSVSTTTSYVAEQVVTPFVRLGGLLAGVRAAATYLARRGEK
jgi:predicted PurR-regulated permease PerM